MARRVSARSAVGDAVADLRSQIISGRLRPGDAVAEDELAQRLGISRTPVREAIGRLVSEGVLTKHDNRTARVFRPSLDELLEIYEIRMPLEIMAATQAVESAHDELSETLREQYLSFSDESAAPSERFTMHEIFHLTLFSGSGRNLLVEVIAGLRLRSEPYVRFAAQVDVGFRERNQAEHAAMIEALVARDGNEMEQLVRRHLKNTTEKVTDLLREDIWLPSLMAGKDITPPQRG